MFDYCMHLAELLEEEMRALEKNPDFNNFKWFRSEEAGHDIGIRSTLIGFSRTEYFQQFCEEYRQRYCGSKCKDRHDCRIAFKYCREVS